MYCVPYAQKRTFSSKRDLTITAVFFKEKNLPLNIFSIRQSGCRSSIIILTNQEMIFCEMSVKMINVLCAKVVRAIIPSSFQKKHSDYIRDIFAYKYVEKHKEDFDRVFFFDSYDVFFEKDPFEFFNGNFLFLFQESVRTINQDASDRNWIKDCYGADKLKEVGGNYFVCSGTVAGSTQQFIKFYSFMTSQIEFDKCGVDQGQINYLLYSGKLKDNGIAVLLFDQNGPVNALNTAAISYGYYFNKYMYVKNPKGEVAHVIHQYKRKKRLLSMMYNRCNIGKFLTDSKAVDKNSIYIEEKFELTR